MGEENKVEMTRDQLKVTKAVYFVSGAFVGLAVAVIGVISAMVF